MIISHRYKFIFVKTAKTAGTSIEAFLSPKCGPEDVVTPISPPVEGHEPRNYKGYLNPIPQLVRRPQGIRSALSHIFQKGDRFYNHMPAAQIRQRTSKEVWDSYFKFCVERNPWDKTLSHYHMAKHRAGGALSLDEYFAKGRFPLNYFRYTDPSGQHVIVDRVLRYEHLMTDLAEVFSQLSIAFDGSLGIRAKSEYRKDRTPYQQVFNEQQRRVIEQVFAREIELHHYHF